MSFGNSYGGGRTRVGTRVFLNVYDLIQPGTTTSDAGSTMALSSLGCGLHHTGIEILGSEYSFSNQGIFSGPPKAVAPNARFRQSLEMGIFEGGSAELRRALQEMEQDDGFEATKYNLIRKNCNHFSNALSWKLLRKTIPAHINRLADLAACFSCLLPRSLLENAPVGGDIATNTQASSSSFGDKQQPEKLMLFSGTGARLGGSGVSGDSGGSTTNRDGLFSRVFSSSTTATTNSTSAGDDPNERRERARLAALARLERQQQGENKQSR